MGELRKNLFRFLSVLATFAFWRWLFGIAVPEAALAFSIGATLTLLGAVLTGRALTLVWLRTASGAAVARSTLPLFSGIVAGLLAMAFLLDAMVRETTLLPFALTVLLFFLTAAAAASLATLTAHRYTSSLRSARARAAQSGSELQLLQSRLSPHFLFNTLNNLYGLSLADPDRVPPLLLRLSELLRYSVYDVKEALVPLQYEVDYLAHYMEFERLRLGDRLELALSLDPRFDPGCRIPPLLLVVFVENAFKHARHAGGGPIRIDVGLHVQGGTLAFSVRNPCALRNSAGPKPEKRSGFGLGSVRRRLELLYPGRHALWIERRPTEFTVKLTLPCP